MKPKYITPRIAIANLTNSQDIPKIKQLVQSRHKQYHHYFNFTKISMGTQRQSHFKWRGIPFSLTETLKMLLQLDAFLRNNLANSAILCVANPPMEQLALFAVKSYVQICCVSAQDAPGSIQTLKAAQLASCLLHSHPYLCKEMVKIYKNIRVESPPMKILESLVVHPQDLFIPLFSIFTQTRYNDFEEVYAHPIEEDLATYYINLGKPLEVGIGSRYYDEKPETKYFKKPVVVCGDVKITVYSYRRLKKEHECTIGFNTLNIDELNSQHEGVIILQDTDLYEKSSEIKQPIRIEIQFSDYCDNVQCKNAAHCSECRQATKRLANRYTQSQGELNKLSRKRSPDEVCVILGV